MYVAQDNPTLFATLTQLVTAEVSRPTPAVASVVAEAIRQQLGSGVAAILFYGSCLRTGEVENRVLDFYALVDSYQAVYPSRVLVGLNAVLPPNVFYIEVPYEGKLVRAKYAVISIGQFTHAVSLRSVHAGIWARFCQPVLLVYSRDESTRTAVTYALGEAIATIVLRAVAFLPVDTEQEPFRPEALWHCGFQATYRAELRPENPTTIVGLYQAAPERYQQVTYAALRELERRGLLELHGTEGSLRVVMPTFRRKKLCRDWRVRSVLAKGLYALRLLKSALTFGDWLPYALWKLERHTGVRIELTERQRRAPLIWGWPVILKLLRQRVLR
jgi:hypothetical protein